MSHAFLSNQDLLLSINHEVATLIIAALPRILHNLIFAQLRQVAEAGAHHHRNLADGHLVLRENGCLRLNSILTCEWVFISILDLEDSHGAEYLCLVG